MIKVIKIDYIDKKQDEAIVLLSDGQYQCYSYCLECRVKQGSIVTEPLYALLSENIFLSNEDVGFYQSKEKLVGKIIARISDLKNNMVQVGEIKIEVDGNFPGDMTEGRNVEFTYTRLDLNL